MLITLGFFQIPALTQFDFTAGRVTNQPLDLGLREKLAASELDHADSNDSAGSWLRISHRSITFTALKNKT